MNVSWAALLAESSAPGRLRDFAACRGGRSKYVWSARGFCGIPRFLPDRFRTSRGVRMRAFSEGRIAPRISSLFREQLWASPKCPRRKIEGPVGPDNDFGRTGPFELWRCRRYLISTHTGAYRRAHRCLPSARAVRDPPLHDHISPSTLCTYHCRPGKTSPRGRLSWLVEEGGAHAIAAIEYFEEPGYGPSRGSHFGCLQVLAFRPAQRKGGRCPDSDSRYEIRIGKLGA